MKNVNSLSEPNGVHRPVGVAVVIFYDFENAGAAEALQWLRVGMLVAHLGPHKSSAHIVFNLFGEIAKSFETISQPSNWLRRVDDRHYDTSALAIQGF